MVIILLHIKLLSSTDHIDLVIVILDEDLPLRILRAEMTGAAADEPSGMMT